MSSRRSARLGGTTSQTRLAVAKGVLTSEVYYYCYYYYYSYSCYYCYYYYYFFYYYYYQN